MAEHEVDLHKLARREFRQALEEGRFKTAVIPTGSVEQHLEHLAMEHDIASCAYIAMAVAERLYPNVIVAPPMSVGISEHRTPVHRFATPSILGIGPLGGDLPCHE